MFGKINFQLDLDPRLAEAAALRLANEMMGISARGTLTEQAKLLLDQMGLASSQHAGAQPQARSARAIDDAEGARAAGVVAPHAGARVRSARAIDDAEGARRRRHPPPPATRLQGAMP